MADYLSPLVSALLANMQQPHARLQASATSALSVVFDIGQQEMSRFVPQTAEALVRCQQVYTLRGYALLCDMLQVLSNACLSDEQVCYLFF